jgi:xylose isomerase
MNMAKLALITGFLSRTKDRFHEYNTPLQLGEKLDLMMKIEGFDGVELVYPYEVRDARQTREALAARRLQIAAVNVNVKGEPEFVSGGLTSSDAAVRAKAVRFIKEAKTFAEEIGADKVTCCPLGDGYEFAFQYNYRVAWRYLVDAFAEAGSFLPEIKLFIEYKPSETRGKCFIDSASKTLNLISLAGVRNLGVTIDFGHSIYGGENPAETVALVVDSGVPMYIHINDNDGKWDWDYFCGTKHFLEYVEFIYYLRKYGYDDYLTSDTSPTRWDIKRTFEANGRITNRLWDFFDNSGQLEIERIMKLDYLDRWEWIERTFFGPFGRKIMTAEVS